MTRSIHLTDHGNLIEWTGTGCPPPSLRPAQFLQETIDNVSVEEEWKIQRPCLASWVLLSSNLKCPPPLSIGEQWTKLICAKPNQPLRRVPPSSQVSGRCPPTARSNSPILLNIQSNETEYFQSVSINRWRDNAEPGMRYRTGTRVGRLLLAGVGAEDCSV